MLNISNSTLSLYESDKRKPDFEILRNIADYLKVTTDYLLGLSNVRTPANPERIYHSVDVTGLPGDAIDKIEEYTQFIKEVYKGYDIDKNR